MIPPLYPNTVLQARYQIIRQLGAGGMGAVYQAYDLRLQGRAVAVKENFDASPAAKVQFQTEATLLANLSHPALPRVTDHFIEPSGRQYLVMDFIEGEDLEQIVTRRGPMAEAHVLRWMYQMLDALEYLHERQPAIIHRDVKPANIKIRPDQNAMLVDFGIAKAYDPTQKTRAAARAVSAGYAPLEQYGRAITDARTDIYAVGATFYFVLTGQIPPEATDLVQGTQTLAPPSRYTRVSPHLENAILRAMAMQPHQRFQTAREFRDALNPSAWTQRVPSAPSGRVTAVAPTMVASPQVAQPAIPFPSAMPSARPVAGVEYASWGRRVLAMIVDSVLVFLAILPFSVCALFLDAIASSGSGYSYAPFSSMLSCVSYLLFGAYFTVLHARTGQTAGKKVAGIRVVRIANNLPPSFGLALARFIAYLVEGFLCYLLIGFLGFLWPLWDSQKQTWHDKVAGTIVVKV